jgi:uncharacterized protein
MKKTFISFCLLFVFVVPAMALDVPPLEGRRVHSHFLTPEQAMALEQKLASYEQKTSNQIALLSIDSLKGEDVKEYAIKVAMAWGLGQAGKDNGVLILHVQEERKLRIEVGKGLEGVLTDVLSTRISREKMAPFFKDGKVYEGFNAGVDNVVAAIGGEFKSDSKKPNNNQKDYSLEIVVGFFGGLIILCIAAGFSAFVHPIVGGLVGAIASPCLYIWMATSYSIGIAVALFILGGLIGVYAGKILEGLSEGFGGSGGYTSYGGSYSSGITGSSSGYSSYGGGSSSGSSSSDNSGGFSGGGGDFGGGGGGCDF